MKGNTFLVLAQTLAHRNTHYCYTLQQSATGNNNNCELTTLQQQQTMQRKQAKANIFVKAV